MSILVFSKRNWKYVLFAYVEAVVWKGDAQKSCVFRTICSCIAFFWWVVISIKEAFYRSPFFRKNRECIPVFNIGGITVGGVGKTPFSIRLMRDLSTTATGAILMRGYGGDETSMMRQKLPGVSIFTGKHRKDTLRMARRQHASFVILDDGWQYRKLWSTQKIALLSALCDFEKESYVPRGRLRDLPARLCESDLVVVNHTEEEEEQVVWRNKIARYTSAPIIFIAYRVQSISWHGNREGVLSAGAKVGVFCGIGTPESFLRTVLREGWQVVDSRLLVDHEPFHPEALASFVEESRQKGAVAILCTEKDMIKVGGEKVFSLPLGGVGIDVTILDGESLYASWLTKAQTLVERHCEDMG